MDRSLSGMMCFAKDCMESLMLLKTAWSLWYEVCCQRLHGVSGMMCSAKDCMESLWYEMF